MIMKWLVRLLSALVIIAAITLYLDPAQRSYSPPIGNEDTASRKVLFLGNSFTSWWEVDKQVAQMAASAIPAVSYYVQAIAPGGYSIDQHLADGKIQDELQSGQWDTLVVQTSSVTAFSAHRVDQALQDFRILSVIARQNNVDIIWYAHWRPNGYNISDQDAHKRISAFYHQAARTGGGKVAEVGFAFDAAQRSGIQGLLSDDMHHASRKGAYVAALEILATLGDVDVKTVTYVPHSDIPQDEARRLREAVARRHSSRF